MSTFKLLKTLTSRRQVLKTGLAALTLSGMSHAIAKEETLKTSNGHSKPKTKKTGSKRLVMLDPDTAASIPARLAATVLRKNTSYWQLPKTCALFCEITESMRV